MKNKNYQAELSNTYGGFLGKYEYEAEQKKRSNASRRSVFGITVAIIISVIVVSVSFNSFVTSIIDSNTEMDKLSSDTEVQTSALPKRISSSQPAALICLSRLGFTGVSIEEKDARRFDIPQGVKLLTVSKTCESAGLRKGDIVVCLDNEFVHSLDDMKEVISKIHDREEINISVYRDGKYKWMTIPLN